MIFESQFETYFNDFVINSKFLNDEPSIIYFIVDEINNPHQIKLKQRLIQIIQASKNKKNITIINCCFQFNDNIKCISYVI